MVYHHLLLQDEDAIEEQDDFERQFNLLDMISPNKELVSGE